jgi:hypothetical protein
MAARPRIAMYAAIALGGLSIPRESFPEAASQTFKAGAPVFVSAGYLQTCGADPTLIMGVACGDGQNQASAGLKQQLVDLAHPLTIFAGNLDDGSGTTTSAATDRGKMYGIAVHASSGKWYVDSTDVTAKRVVIWDFWDGAQDGSSQVVGDTLAWVFFQFDPQYFQGNKTS